MNIKIELAQIFKKGNKDHSVKKWNGLQINNDKYEFIYYSFIINNLKGRK